MTSHHPSGYEVEIVGLKKATNGRSCEYHDPCGDVVQVDTVLRLRSVSVWMKGVVGGAEEQAIAAYWVSDGIDRCRVGFLRKEMVNQRHLLDGVLVQVVELMWLSDLKADRERSHRNYGLARAMVISTVGFYGLDTEKKIKKENKKGSKKRTLDKV